MCQLFFHPDVKSFRSLMSAEEASFSDILSTSLESFVLLKLPVCLMS